MRADIEQSAQVLTKELDLKYFKEREGFHPVLKYYTRQCFERSVLWWKNCTWIVKENTLLWSWTMKFYLKPKLSVLLNWNVLQKSFKNRWLLINQYWFLKDLFQKSKLMKFKAKVKSIKSILINHNFRVGLLRTVEILDPRFALECLSVKQFHKRNGAIDNDR